MRDEKYDIARGLAIYLVVLGHVLAQYGYGESAIIDFCHMPLFFFVSGYFLYPAIKKYSYGQLLKKKARTLLIPYAIWSLVSFFANMGMQFLHGGLHPDVAFEEFLNIFVYARSVWFLLVLFLSVALLMTFAYFTNRYWKLWCLLTWFLFSVLVDSRIMKIYKLEWLFPFMMLGYILAEKGVNPSGKRTSWPICGIGTLLYAVAAHFLYREDSFLAYSTFCYSSWKECAIGIGYAGISLLGIVALMMLSQQLSHGKCGKLLQYTGIKSMDIYVIHMLLIKFLAFPIGWTGLPAYGFFIVYSLVIVLVSLGISRLCQDVRLYRFSLGR